MNLETAYMQRMTLDEVPLVNTFVKLILRQKKKHQLKELVFFLRKENIIYLMSIYI